MIIEYQRFELLHCLFCFAVGLPSFPKTAILKLAQLQVVAKKSALEPFEDLLAAVTAKAPGTNDQSSSKMVPTPGPLGQSPEAGPTLGTTDVAENHGMAKLCKAP